MQQIERLSKMQAGSRYPSAFSLGKMLLMLSGDAEANPAAEHEADKLAAIAGATARTTSRTRRPHSASSRCSSAA